MTDTTATLDSARADLAAERFLPAHAAALTVLRRTPDDVAAIAIKAAAEQGVGQSPAAEASLRHALTLDPRASEIISALALLLTATRRGAEAESLLRQSIEAGVDSAAVHALMGMRLSDGVALVAGEWHLRRAQALGDTSAALLAALGANLVRQARADEALPLLEEASGRQPDVFTTTGNLAIALERVGRVEDARAAVERSKPAARLINHDTIVQEARLLGLTPEWRDGLAMLERTPALSGSGMLERGRLRDRAGDHAGAWTDYVEGKRTLARDAGFIYFRDEVDAHAARLKEIFTRAAAAPVARA